MEDDETVRHEGHNRSLEVAAPNDFSDAALGIGRDGSQPLDDGQAYFRGYLKRVFEGTQKIGQNLSSGKVVGHWQSEDVPEAPRRFQSTKVSFYIGDMIQLAILLGKTFKDTKWALEDFANNFKHGGGVFHGARAQEESMCRQSTLYNALRQLRYPLGTKPSGLIARGHEYMTGTALLQGVTFFREGRAKSFACIAPVTLDVVVVSGPHFHKGDPTARSAAARAVMEQVTRNVIHAAGHGECDGLIIGLLGGGAFNGDAETIIEASLDAIAASQGVVREVIFAVMSDHNSTGAEDVTERIMRSGGVERFVPPAPEPAAAATADAASARAGRADGVEGAAGAGEHGEGGGPCQQHV